MEDHANQSRPLTNDPREVRGWMLYDWANSAFSTTVVSALFGPYLTMLAQGAIGENGVVIGIGGYALVTAKGIFTACVSLSVLLQVFLLPVLGAIADYSHLKKRLMTIFCYIGVLATCLLVFITASTYLLGALLFIIANLGFGASIVLYNSFLPDIASPDQADKVSSRGFALGYLGGGLLLAANLALVVGAVQLGISTGTAVRLSLLSAGLWWGGFALLTFAWLRPRGAARALPPGKTYVTIAFSELADSFRVLFKLPHTLRYLVSYLFYNDGIQTVISAAAVFLAQELFVARGLAVDQSFLVGLILLVQFVAFAGALLFERVAGWLGTKNAILIALVIWTGVIIYAYSFLQTVTQAWAMGAVIALVLGGSQALSRSLFARMIPKGREASFFGLYEISERGTSWIGPLIFTLVIAATNSYREAILSLIVLFVIGIGTLLFTNTDQAIRDAGNEQ